MKSLDPLTPIDLIGKPEARKELQFEYVEDVRLVLCAANLEVATLTMLYDIYVKWPGS